MIVDTCFVLLYCLEKLFIHMRELLERNILYLRREKNGILYYIL